MRHAFTPEVRSEAPYITERMDTSHLSTLVEIAADVRRRAGQKEPAFSTMQIIEACFPGTLVTGRALDPRIDEMVMRASSHVIIYRRSLTIPEQRIAIAHALGHMLLDFGKPQCVNMAECEARADRFAEELLVPLTELAPYVCEWPSEDPMQKEIYLDMVDILASQFGVPPSVIDKRIRELPRPIS